MANTVDPDETAHYEPSHLDLQFFANAASVVFDALRVNDCNITKLFRELRAPTTRPHALKCTS